MLCQVKHKEDHSRTVKACRIDKGGTSAVKMIYARLEVLSSVVEL